MAIEVTTSTPDECLVSLFAAPPGRKTEAAYSEHQITVLGLHFDLDVDARGQIQFHQGVNGFIRRIENVDQPLV